MLQEKEITIDVKEPASFVILPFSGSLLPKEYESLLFAKWLRSLRKGNELFSKIDAGKYFYEYHAFIERLLKKPDFLVKFAVLSDDHDVVLGFSCSREDVLDYVYVQNEMRGQKISTALIPQGITTFSHITNMWAPIWQSKYKEWKFNPFA